MAHQYTCYVPKEWSVLSKQVLTNTITDKATQQWQRYKNLEGTTIRLENVTGKFNYYQFNPWLRKPDDRSSYPHANEYFGIQMKCILCSQPCRSYGRRCCNY